MDLHAHSQPRVHCVAGLGRFFEQGRQIVVSAQVGKMNSLAAHGELHLVRELQAAHDVQVGPIQLRLELVFAIQRKIVMHQNPADGPQGQPFHVLVLRKVLANAEGGAGSLGVGISHRQRADARRGGQITLLERWRKTQDIGHIVEAVGRIVGRQQRGGVHVEREKIANCIGVLGAIHAVKQGTPRVRLGLRRAIQPGFDGSNEFVRGVGVRAGHSWGRHRARTQLHDHFFPGLGVGGDFGEVHGIQHEAAGFEALVMTGDAVLVDELRSLGRAHNSQQSSGDKQALWHLFP